MTPLALVVLAAGESRRLGACKALVRLGPDERSTPLALLLGAGAPVTAAPPLVVTGADDADIRAAAHAGPEGIELAHNADWREGRAGSLRLAARLRPNQDLLVAPVDVPLVAPATFRALAERWVAAGRPARGWLAPRSSAAGAERTGRFGHPVVIGRALAAELCGWPAERSLRLLREQAAPLLVLEVDDPAVLDDLDTPADLARLRQRVAADSEDPSGPGSEEGPPSRSS